MSYSGPGPFPRPPVPPNGPSATVDYGPNGVMNSFIRANPQVDLNAQLAAFMNWRGAMNPTGGSHTHSGAPMPVQQERGPLAPQEDALRRAQLEDAKLQLLEGAQARSMRKIPINMGIYGLAHDWDTRSMTPMQQRLVNPESSQFQGNADRPTEGRAAMSRESGNSTEQKLLSMAQSAAMDKLAGAGDNSAAMQRYGWGQNYDLLDKPYSWQVGGGAISPAMPNFSDVISGSSSRGRS